ncbi:TPA: hypothetical protein EYP70_04470 [Candidatus Bathyarchaeota archaeon]|nr:hypothetical protein [Candidatus Bathyarchaeota archaeon]
MFKSLQEARKSIQEKRRELEERVKETCIIVVLLGAGGQGLERRRNLDEKLEKEGILCLVPEDDFAPDVAPSLTEEAVLEEADVDLIFVNVESWGSVTEFVKFHDKKNVAQKLRVLTFYEYHPMYGTSASYLTDVYLTHMVKYGHVYAYDDNRRSNFPTSEKIIITIATRHR